MSEVLSTIGLTAGAAIVIGFLAYAMAETPRGRLTVAGVLTAWFALVVTIGASAALDPVRGFGVPALGLTVGLPCRGARQRLLRLWTDFGGHAGGASAGAGRGECDPVPPAGWLFALLYARGELPAPFAPSAGWGDILAGAAAPAIAWLLVRFGHVSRRSFLCGASSGYRRSRHRDRAWRPIGARSASSVCRAAHERHHDHPALAHRSRIPAAGLTFIHVVIFHRLASAGASVAAHPWLDAGATKPT